MVTHPSGPDPDPESPPGADPGRRSDPGDELVEWVDGDGRVIEVVSRRRMRAEGLAHRCTYVVVAVGPVDRFTGTGSVDELSPDDEIIVHQRADWKDVAPSHWDLAFGGVCGVGEGWESSARRELAEEAGIDLTPEDRLVDLGPTHFVDADSGGVQTAIHGRLFLASWPGQPVSTDGEAVAFSRLPIGGLTSWMAERQVCADSASVVAPVLLGLAGADPKP